MRSPAARWHAHPSTTRTHGTVPQVTGDGCVASPHQVGSVPLPPMAAQAVSLYVEKLCVFNDIEAKQQKRIRAHQMTEGMRNSMIQPV